MRHMSKATAIVIIVVLGLIIPAMAGGAVWHFDGEYRPGDIAESTTSVSWGHSGSLGRPEDGPFLIYLATAEATTGTWPDIPTDTMLVGIVDIEPGPYEGADGQMYGPHHATARFEIPQVPPGDYQIFHCNDPCTRTLGDIIGGWDLKIVEGPDGRPPIDIADEVEMALVVYPPWPEDSTVSLQDPSDVPDPIPHESSANLLVPPQASVAASNPPVAELDDVAMPGPIQTMGSDEAGTSPLGPASIGILLVAVLFLMPLAGAVTSRARRHAAPGEQP